MARTCPNARCRAIHPDEIGQCPECGAPMSRTPDAVQDVNTHLFGLRANAGVASYAGGNGGARVGPEPSYRDTQAVMETARDVVLRDLFGGGDDDGEAHPDV